MTRRQFKNVLKLIKINRVSERRTVTVYVKDAQRGRRKMVKIIVEGQTPVANKEGEWKQLLKIDLSVLRKLKTPHKFRHDLRISVE